MIVSNIDKSRAIHFRNRAIMVETLTNCLIGSQRESNSMKTIIDLTHYVLELTNGIDNADNNTNRSLEES